MSKALITEGYLTDIANAIRAKNGSADTYTPPQMAAAITAIPTGSDVDVESLNVGANGTYTAPSGKAYSPVTVLVPNTYGSGDEGKVVQNGALVAQTSRTLAQNGTYDTTTNDSVTVDVSGGGGGGGVEATVAVENGALVTDGVTVVTQPVITDDQIGASTSAGLSFTFNAKLEIEFDLTLKNGNHVTLSFGGSNTIGGVYLIAPDRFHLYANGAKFNIPISLSQDVKYRVKIVFTNSSATLYVDGEQIAVGESVYVRNAITHLIGGSDVALLYNQSAHAEYSLDLIDNLVIRIS